MHQKWNKNNFRKKFMAGCELGKMPEGTHKILNEFVQIQLITF